MSSSVLIVEYIHSLYFWPGYVNSGKTCYMPVYPIPPLAERKQVQRGEMTSLKGLELDATLGLDLSI